MDMSSSFIDGLSVIAPPLGGLDRPSGL
uniref:Uncharacterized protein n=1 Tax=Moniliophthora roreri TaxID=221103 RepID=A0A0W0EW05_MONRR